MSSIEADRVLAQIVKILEINSIEKADAIELATVLGWNVVIKKGDFKVGDLVIYFSIDSVLENTMEYCKFLDGKPLKTKKMRGVISQGLLGPLQWINFHNNSIDISQLKEDDDVTEILNVKKYVHPTEEYNYNLSATGRSPFPQFVPKTDEERIQNMPVKLKKIFDNNYNVVITKKFDGTSSTYVYYKPINNEKDVNEKFLICSRNNVIINVEDNSMTHYFDIEKKYKIEEKMKELGKNIAIQGEICGPKIGGNKLKLKEREYFVFNIYDIENKKYLLWNEVVELSKKLGVNTVDVIYYGKLQQELSNIKNLLDFTDKQTYSCGDIAEGIVVKTDDINDRISFKVISNKFLLKHNI